MAVTKLGFNAIVRANSFLMLYFVIAPQIVLSWFKHVLLISKQVKNLYKWTSIR